MSRFFNSINDVLEKADNASLSVTGDLTAFAWFRHSGVARAANEGIVSKYRSQSGSVDQRAYVLYWTSADVLGLTISDDGTFKADGVLEGSTGLSTAIWYFGAMVIDVGTSMKLYLGTTAANLAEEASDTTSILASIADTAAPLWIGLQFSDIGDGWFGGDIAHDGVIAETMTLQQLKAIAYGYSPSQIGIAQANIRAFHPLFGVHSPEIDYSGNGNDLTVTGAIRSNHPPIIRSTRHPAINPFAVAVAAGAGIRNPFGGPMVLRNPLGA